MWAHLLFGTSHLPLASHMSIADKLWTVVSDKCSHHTLLTRASKHASRVWNSKKRYQTCNTHIRQFAAMHKEIGAPMYSCIISTASLLSSTRRISPDAFHSQSSLPCSALNTCSIDVLLWLPARFFLVYKGVFGSWNQVECNGLVPFLCSVRTKKCNGTVPFCVRLRPKKWNGMATIWFSSPLFYAWWDYLHVCELFLFATIYNYSII
jgi:hypothetical protein